MNHSNYEEAKSFFSGERLIDSAMLMNNLKFGQSVCYDTLKQSWVVENSLEDLVVKLRDKAVEKRFENMEFALDEKGRPDGLKNKQEMVLTIAGDIADKMNDLIFEEAKKVLEREDWLDRQAMEMLKESKEK